MKPFDGKTKYAPQRDDVDRALGVLAWMRWCNAARLPERLTKAAIALARGGDQELVHRLYCPTRKPESAEHLRDPDPDRRLHPDRTEERPRHRPSGRHQLQGDNS